MAGRIGIITGLAFEAALVARISKQLNWGVHAPEVRCIGMGGAGALAAAEELAAQGVDGLVSFGLAGGLDPAVASGTLVVPETIIAGAAQTYPVTPEWRSAFLANLGPTVAINHGAIFAGAEMITTPADKQAAWHQSGAVAADMESAEIAAAAKAAGLAFLAVRAVADEAGTALPPAATAMSTDGKMATGALIASLVRNPGQIPGLIRLGLKTRRACGALETALNRSGPRAGT